MQHLNSGQRQYLKRLGHDLRPVVQIGKQGLTPGVIESINTALEAHELIKVKFLEFQDEKQELARTIEAETRSEQVALVGNVLLLFREQADHHKRKISLPV